MKYRFFLRTIIVFPVVSVLLLAGCGRAPVTDETGAAGEPMAVAVEEARSSTVAYSVGVPGQVRAAHEAVISSRIQGQVVRLAFAPGDRVEEGEVLAELASPELAARVRRAEAELEAATLELERVRNLTESRAATAQDLEAADARQRSARAALDEAETFQNYAIAHAPFSGIVIRKHVEPGDLVSPGQPIVALQSPALFRLEAAVPETLAGALEVGDQIGFEIDRPGISGSAVISEIEPAADPATRTFLVKADLPDEPALRGGQFGRLLVPGREAKLLTVPETGLRRRGHLEYVFVVSEGRARLRLIRTGRSIDGRLEVLSGLDEGAAVVVEIPAGLSDGQPVEMQR